jgi:Na+/H+-translocating membrane pyrophosphatase
MLSPILTGMFFGTRTLAGLLVGALVSGVQVGRVLVAQSRNQCSELSLSSSLSL